MTLSIDAEKVFNKKKLNIFFMIKALNKFNIEKEDCNIIKAIYDKHTVNIILNGEKLKAFSRKPRTRQGCQLLLFLFTIVPES